MAAFPAVEAPNWKIGSKLYLGFTVVATLIFFAIHYRLRWEARRKAKQAHHTETIDESDEVQQVGDGERSFGIFEKQEPVETVRPDKGDSKGKCSLLTHSPRTCCDEPYSLLDEHSVLPIKVSGT